MLPPDEGARRPAGYKWIAVALLWFVCFFNYADRQAVYTVFKPIGDEMNLGKADLGVVGSSFMWVYALAAPLAGLVGDRGSRKWLVIGGLLFWSLVCAATALSTRYWQLILFRGLEGFGEAFYFPASMALISDLHGPRTRSRALGIHQSGVYLGTVGGGTISGVLAERHGWRSSFVLLGALGVVLAIVLVLFLKEARRGESDGVKERLPPVSPLRAAKELVGSPMVLVLLTVFVGANFVAAIFLTWLTNYLQDEFQMSLSLSGFNGTVFLQAASIAGVIAGGALADRLALRRRGGRMMVQAAGLLLGAPFIVVVGEARTAALLLSAVVGFGFFKGMYDSNIWASLHDHVRPELRASVVGMGNAVGWIGGGVASIYIGVASEKLGIEMGHCIAAGAAVYLAMGLLLAWRLRSAGPRSPGTLEEISLA